MHRYGVNRERPSNKNVLINIFAKKPEVIKGKSGNDVDKFKKSCQKIIPHDSPFL